MPVIATRSSIPFMHRVHKLEPVDLVPPFEISLPSALRYSGEKAMYESCGLTRESYSTARYLSKTLASVPTALRSLPTDNGNCIRCESNCPILQCYSSEHGLRLASDSDAYSAIGLILAALSEVVEPYPFLMAAISELVWSCHIVIAQGDDYDASFSDPAVPFSIFVSVPVKRDRASILRVAENLIHETMHLQLSLFERYCPLVNTQSTISFYSPWKKQDRPVQGIVHGLYVFCVLRWMWRQVLRTSPNDADKAFASRRIAEINDDISAVRDLKESPLITESGGRFLSRLYAA